MTRQQGGRWQASSRLRVQHPSEALRQDAKPHLESVELNTKRVDLSLVGGQEGRDPLNTLAEVVRRSEAGPGLTCGTSNGVESSANVQVIKSYAQVR